MSMLTHKKLRFEDLKGWADDDHQAALTVFRNTVDLIDGDAWRSIEGAAQTAADARTFFETCFDPVLIEDGQDMLFTGYYEPELSGALTQGGIYQHPIYAVPLDIALPYFTRRQIDEDQPLAARGLEIAWLADPVDVFFLQVQGSGRIRLPDGEMIRVGFAAKNGHPYTSIGKVLIGNGAIAPDQINPDTIRAWVQANGDAGRALLWENESYVFFREIGDVPIDQGPLGAMNRSITAGRSIAVDPEYTPFGAPVWIEKQGMHRLMVAQDTGSAIKGAQRADIFCETGAEAGRINDAGLMITLLPKGMTDA